MKTSLSEVTFDEIANADFKLYAGNPVITNFGLSFVAADPSLLTPSEAQDGKWHLFCHTFTGVYRLDSEDGLSFSKPKKVVSRAMRPNINCIDGRYYLFFERTRSLIGNALTLLGAKWKSVVCVSESCDLDFWTKPVPVINHTRPYEVDEHGQMISNPFLVRIGDAYRLYYSCGQTFIEDCGFTEPKYISFAESLRINCDYSSRPTPIISPDENSEYFNLCSGCLKVYRLKDCYIGLQNGIFMRDGKSESAILLLRSADGENFSFEKALIEPSGRGIDDWMSQYVYASCFTLYNGELRIYFNARNTADSLKGREGIGLAVAKLP